MRKTKQKEYIWEAFERFNGHPTPEDIYAVLKPNHPKLSLATVYRNLSQFADKGLIGRVDIPNRPMCFDITTEPHLHAVCNECGKVYDITSPKVSKLGDLIYELTDMDITDYNLVLYVNCPDCEEKNLSQPKTATNMDETVDIMQENGNLPVS